MLTVKIHPTSNGKILVVSDKEILGRKFEEGNLQLDLSKEFYRGEEKPEAEIKALVKAAYLLHLTGRKTLKFFSGLGIINKKRILIVKGIPHAEVYLGEK